VARVTLELPSLLQQFFDGRRSIELEAQTLAGALAELLRIGR
jgi:hypothetical protein